MVARELHQSLSPAADVRQPSPTRRHLIPALGATPRRKPAAEQFRPDGKQNCLRVSLCVNSTAQPPSGPEPSHWGEKRSPESLPTSLTPGDSKRGLTNLDYSGQLGPAE